MLGIPVTTVARTLVDLAAVLGVDALARACHEAGVLHGTTPGDVEAVLERRPASPGRRSFGESCTATSTSHSVGSNAASSRCSGPNGCRSPRRTASPAAGASTAGGPTHRLTVELDGYRYHRSRHAWEQDRRREREARARGDEFRRYTYGDVLEDSRFMLPRASDSSSGSCPA